MTFENVNYLLGGSYEKRQISQVQLNRLNRIGTLPFDFALGACTVVNQQIMMCFHQSTPKKCRLTTNFKTFTDVSKSLYDHRGIRIATNSMERTMALGSNGDSENVPYHGHVELLDSSTWSWYKADDYPYDTR